jgi:hypothetical protein
MLEGGRGGHQNKPENGSINRNNPEKRSDTDRKCTKIHIKQLKNAQKVHSKRLFSTTKKA